MVTVYPDKNKHATMLLIGLGPVIGVPRFFKHIRPPLTETLIKLLNNEINYNK